MAACLDYLDRIWLANEVNRARPRLRNRQRPRSIAFTRRLFKPLGIVHALDYDGKDGPEGHPDLKALDETVAFSSG
jgi:hypothetical protein